MTVGSPPASRVTGAGPVVICCAPDDASQLEEVVRELEAAGNAVELCLDAAADPKALGPVIDRCHGEGLYVLCRSHGLDRQIIDALREILLAHHVPFGRTLTVASRRPRELLERINTGLKRLAVGRQRRMTRVSPEGEKVPRRPTVLGMPVPKRAAAARAKPSPPPGDDPPTEDNEDTVSHVTAPIAPETTRSTKPPGLIPFDEQTTIEVDHDWIAQEEREFYEAFRGNEVEDERRVEHDDHDEQPQRDPEDSLAGVSLITAADLADLADDDSDADENPIELSASDMVVEQPRVPPPPRTKVLITGDTVVARAPVSDYVIEQQRPTAPPASPPAIEPAPMQPHQIEPDAAASAAPSAAPGLPMPAPIAGAEAGKRRIGLWAAVGAVSLIGLVMIAFALGGDDAKDGDMQASDADGDVEHAAGDDDPEPDEAPKIEPEPEPDATLPGQMHTAVMAALRSRKVRALDILLVASVEGPRMPYADAQSYCRTLEVEGLQGWRLPEVGELSSLAAAGMLGSGVYWSDTPADTFGDQRLAWYARRDRVVAPSRDSEVVCVRGERAAQ